MNLNNIDDILYLILLIIPFCIYAYVYLIIKKNYKIKGKSNLTGFDIARKIFNKNHLKDYIIIETPDYLSDNYDLNRETLRLSSLNYHDDSISSYACSSFISYKILHDLKNKNIAKYKNEIDRLSFPTIGIVYILLLIGLIINDMSVIKVSVVILLLIFIYYIFTTLYRYSVYKVIKENDKNFDDYKNVYKVLVLFDYTNYVSVIVKSIKYIQKKYF